MKTQRLISYCRTSRLLLFGYLFIIGFIAVSSTTGNAQWIDVKPSISPACTYTGRDCCFEFTSSNWLASMKRWEVNLEDCSCWDTNCIKSQFPMTVCGVSVNLDSLTTTSSPCNIGLHFSAASPLPANCNFQLLVCPRKTCSPTGKGWNWSAWDSAEVLKGYNYGTFSCDTSVTPCNPTCDLTAVQAFPCYFDVCFFKRANYIGSSGGAFRITFNPPINLTNCKPIADCDTGIVLPTGAQISHIDSNLDGGVKSIDITTTVFFSRLTACDWVCFHIPRCDPILDTAITIHVVDLSDPSHPCSSSPTVTFKPSSNQRALNVSGEDNFPNPLTRLTQFKTTIPFELKTDGGDARIIIVDASGKAVYSETQTFAGSGKHYFYFTGQDLPSGTYYYTIESPLGRAIVRRQLLIVK